MPSMSTIFSNFFKKFESFFFLILATYDYIVKPKKWTHNILPTSAKYKTAAPTERDCRVK